MDIRVQFDSLKDGLLVIEYKEDDFLKLHSYEVPLDFFIKSDRLVALITSCRPKQFSIANFNFPISGNAQRLLERDYNISVSSKVVEDNKLFGVEPVLGILPERSKRFLSFSGGVDSLAAKYLIGRDADILSIDYGPRFQRESDFFTKWQTLVIKTDFRDKPFNESIDWRFMSAGAILMSDYIGIETVIFGTILEASPYWFDTIYRSSIFEEPRQYQPPFALADIKSGQAVTSLSEFGTTKVAHCFGEEILGQSIRSAADEKTTKKLRKILLGKIITGEEITEQWAKDSGPDVLPKSGASFADDILGLYFAWKLGADFTDKYILKMDEEFASFSNGADMHFFEKYNQFNLSSSPPDLKRKFIEVFKEIGIEPYNDEDVAALQAVRSFLSSRFKFKP